MDCCVWSCYTSEREWGQGWAWAGRESVAETHDSTLLNFENQRLMYWKCWQYSPSQKFTEAPKTLKFHSVILGPRKSRTIDSRQYKSWDWKQREKNMTQRNKECILNIQYLLSTQPLRHYQVLYCISQSAVISYQWWKESFSDLDIAVPGNCIRNCFANLDSFSWVSRKREI